MSTYFTQPCPTCGRLLQVRVQSLGRRIGCRHCHGQFESCDPESAQYPPEDSGISLLQRADALLGAATVVTRAS